MTWIALLRGINVGGTGKLAMKDLVAIFGKAGCADVRSYIQSGNVVFRAPRALAERVPALVRAAVEKRFGFAPAVVVRSAEELAKVARDNPFLKRGAQPKQLHVAFLAERPTAARVKLLDPGRSPSDEFVVRGREIHLFCPNGIGRSKLTSDYFESRLETACTFRNWNTVLALLELVQGEA